MNNLTSIVSDYQRKVDELLHEFNSKKTYPSVSLIDRSHYCKNGNICPTYICGNCGHTLIAPWDKIERTSMVITHDWIYCNICKHKNSTFKQIRQWTYEGIDGFVKVKKIPQGRFFLVVPDVDIDDDKL